MLPYVLILVVSVVVADIKGDFNGGKCPALDEPEVKHFDIKLPELQVPPTQTTYVCQQYKIPDELLSVPYHIVAFTPLIDNHEVMHHQILFGCADGTPESDPHSCGIQEATCRSFLTVWSLGFDKDICLYPKTGISIGKNGYKTLSLQIHWNNQNHEANMTDSTGIRIYYSPILRKYELGNVQIGQSDIEIPASSVRNEVSGGCSNYCTSKLFTKPFYLTRTYIHMHTLGVAGRMDLYRNGSFLSNIAYDQTYSYMSPPVHDHQRAIKILPGDEIKLTCWFTSSGGERERNRTIYWGEGSEGEMCFAFVAYFPKAAGFDQCVQFADYDQCDNYIDQTMKMGDCDFMRFMPEVGGDIGTVRLECDEKTTPACDSACVKSIKNIYSHPCNQGRLAVMLQHRAAKTVNWKKISSIHDKVQNCFAHGSM